MLVTLKQVLPHARAHRYAVAAFDCVEDIMVRAILETAEALRSPVILMCLPEDLTGNGMAYLPGLIRAVAEHHPVPVVLHLDHATELDLVKAAIDAGFSSVMVDGSKLSFAQNVRLTRAVVELAESHGVSVEGELGHVGGMDLNASACADSILTDPTEVSRFVKETEVDALAVSIGTAHGVYQSLPNLDLGRLKELNAASHVPLVLHGGSGTPRSQLQEAVRNGIAKLNIYADCRLAMSRGARESIASLTREDPLPDELFGPIRKRLETVVADKIQLLFSEGRAEGLEGSTPHARIAD